MRVKRWETNGLRELEHVNANALGAVSKAYESFLALFLGSGSSSTLLFLFSALQLELDPVAEREP